MEFVNFSVPKIVRIENDMNKWDKYEKKAHTDVLQKRSGKNFIHAKNTALLLNSQQQQQQ